MTLRVKTVEYVLEPRLTNLASNTTIATATRHDTPAITITLPETTSRTFRSVKLMITWRDAYTTATNHATVRIGILLGAAAFSDVDYVLTSPGQSGDHEYGFFTRDVTSYFTTNFGSGSTQTCQVGFAFQTGSTAPWNNITFKLLITYEYDDSGLSEEVKTVRIPIQSHHTTLTASQQEFGTTGGTTNAPANQIPQLTGVGGFLPEGSVSIKSAWIEWWANDAGAATTDFALIYQIDSATEVTHVTLEQALNTGVFFHTHSIYDTSTYSTTSAHALKARSATATRFTCLGAVLHVTYTYNPTTTTTVCNSVCLPIGGSEISRYLNGTGSTDTDSLSIKLWVPEPSTITLKQSGVLMYITSANGGTLNVLSGSQTNRPYTLTSLVNAGGYALVHRMDHSSGMSLSRGKNEATLKMYFGTATGATLNGGFAYLNYHSGVAATGINTHNKTTFWSIEDMATSASQTLQREIATTDQKEITFPESQYWINHVGYDIYIRVTNTAQNLFVLLSQAGSGEHNGSGWYPIATNTFTNDAEFSTVRFTVSAPCAFNKSPVNTGAMDLQTTRKYRMQHFSTVVQWLSGIWVTHHSVTFSVSGIITGSSGGTVNINVYDTTDKTVLGSTSRVGNGAYTIYVYDNSRTMYAEAREDDTLIGRSPNSNAT